MGYCPLVVLCLPLADLHHFCLTKQFPKIPAPSSRSEHHLHFALIRLCLAFLFIISMIIRLPNNKVYGLSPSGSHHSLLFDQEFQKIAGTDQSATGK